ncbi:HIT family protein [Sphingomicrobium lutaoense]|uniref:HIT family protein n=1 Tax=Sphingomicrobium lutaoense TaxID=515949 RepID=UPI00161EB8F3|nr:HIT family protein [Sphingomicrobium lutaoense]
MNETIEKFGYPDTLIREYRHWMLLLRPAQVTLGSMVLAAKSDATRLHQISPEAFSEQHEIISDVERLLDAHVAPQKINYLMLMMVDPHVHSHVIPRYEGSRQFAGLDFEDHGWPGPPDLGKAVKMEKTVARQIINAFQADLC